MQILMNPKVRPQLLVVTAAALALIVVCLLNYSPRQISDPARTTVNTAEVARLNLQLNNSSDPVERGRSAQRLGAIASRQLQIGVSTTSPGTSPAEIQENLNRALLAETDATARASMVSALTQIRNNDMIQSSLNPLNLRFK